MLKSEISRFLNAAANALKELPCRLPGPFAAGDRRFCEKWARLSSPEYVFEERREDAWCVPCRVEFYDLHRWDGEYTQWNGHDVGSAEGATPAEAWNAMADAIVEYENAASREEAILKAELASAARLTRPSGWGDREYAAFYRR